MEILFMILLFIVAVFMVLLVLIQRGRGGGLVGAFGGMGGQSAFGTKAGDLFTRITMWSALVWIVLCGFATKCLNEDVSKLKVQGQAPPPGRVEGIAAPPPAEPPADAETKPGETKPGDAQAGETKPSESKSSGPATNPTKPAEKQPADTKTGDGKS
jgi:preprotein translocase subunit SecG